jgi:hypothetical protein
MEALEASAFVASIIKFWVLNKKRRCEKDG